MELKLLGIIVATVLHLVECQSPFIELPAVVAPADPPPSLPIQRHMEFEEVLSRTQLNRQQSTRGLEYWIWRSEASDLKVLRMEDVARQARVNFILCINPIRPFRNVSIKVENIRYSNDGPSDTIYLSLNGIALGEFVTQEKWGGGHEWNVFHNTGPIGETRELPRGRYTLSVEVETDQWGVEYDRISIDATNQNTTTELICDANLVETLPRQPKPFIFRP